MLKLSVSIITLNEEKWLGACLESVKKITDLTAQAVEIVVVDSGSTDKTVEIAKKYGAKIYFRKFDNYANQKNFAAQKCAGEWILSLDGDEEISSALAEEIEYGIMNNELCNKARDESGIERLRLSHTSYPIIHNSYVAFSIPRKNIIFGKFIRYTRWQPELDRHIWLWKKDAGKWEGDVHEEVVVEGKVGKLKNAKIHHQYETVREFMDMVNRYSEIEARQKVKNGTKFSYTRMLFEPFYNFLVRYFYRLGFLDGWRGFVLSYLMGIYHLVVWVKVGEECVRCHVSSIRYKV